MPSLARPRFAQVRMAGVVGTSVVALLLIAPGRLGHPLEEMGSSPTGDQAQLARRDAGDTTLPATVAKGAISGSLGEAQRAKTVAQVGATVDQWLTQTYLEGRSAAPASPSGRSIASKKIASAAGREAVLRGPGNAASAQVRKKKVSVDLLALNGTARAATARIRLEVVPAPGARPVTVRGRLFLSRHRGSWRIFGYDLAKAGGSR